MRVAIRSLFAALAVVPLLTGSPVSAHTKLVESSPPADATLSELPKNIELQFSEDIKRGAAVVLTAPRARRIEVGEIKVDGKRVSVPVEGKAQGDGGYTIAYRVVSADGHPVSGRVDFKLGGGGSGGLFGANIGVPVMIAILLGSAGLGVIVSSLVSRRQRRLKNAE